MQILKIIKKGFALALEGAPNPLSGKNWPGDCMSCSTLSVLRNVYLLVSMPGVLCGAGEAGS